MNTNELYDLVRNLDAKITSSEENATDLGYNIYMEDFPEEPAKFWEPYRPSADELEDELP
jgi:hypothetical protein